MSRPPFGGQAITMQVGYHLCENGDLERREGEFRLCDGPAAKQPGITDGRIGIMSNERDRISEYFEARGVSRGEFEALKRFGDYETAQRWNLNANGRR